jgi:hypothetical protein
MDIPQIQVDLLQHLAGADGPRTISDVAAALQIDQAQITAATVAMQDAGWVSVDEQKYEELRLGPEGAPYVDQPLPERVVVGVIRSQGGSVQADRGAEPLRPPGAAGRRLAPLAQPAQVGPQGWRHAGAAGERSARRHRAHRRTSG